MSVGGFHVASSKHDYANWDQFLPNFNTGCKIIQLVSLPNLKSFGPMKIELWAKEVGKFCIMLYGKMDWWGLFCQPT